MLNTKTGTNSSYRKIWLDGNKARIEQYDNTGTKLMNVLLTDGKSSFMYSPRTKKATVFSGIQLLASSSSAFITEDNVKNAYGPLVKPLDGEDVNGINCRVYKVGGMKAWFDANTGQGVKYGSSGAIGLGGSYFSDVKFPADSSAALYTLPKATQTNDPSFKPGVGGK